MNKGKKGLIINLVKVFLILVIIGLISVPIVSNLKFGLDLQGGFEVLYQVKNIDDNDNTVTSDMVTSTYKTLLKRIDGLGVSEPSITIEGSDRIRVQLAGVTDEEEARNLLGKTASLTFRDTSDNLLATSDVLRSGGAKVSQDDKMNYVVSLSVSDKEAFYKMTKKVSEMDDNRIVIWLDYNELTDSFSKEQTKCGSLGSSRCISVATVSQGFASDVIIQGNFELNEVKTLVELINSGSLPTKLEELSSKTVEASFGADSLVKTFEAGVVGIALIMLLMIIIYRFSGMIASTSLLIYTFATLFIFWLIGGVLTLPGVAAMIIGIGMAVDANVITFSRIKDELKTGIKLPSAFKKGNQNSFSTIIDSNITTLLVAIILFIFGESSVKGFATMLIISTLVTMFVMIVITRTLLKWFVETNVFNDHLTAFIGVNKKEINTKKESFKNVDFVNLKKYCFTLTIVLIVIGVISLFTTKLNLGIDFKGGSSITITSDEKLVENDLKQDITDNNYNLVNIEFINDKQTNITIDNTLSKDEAYELEAYFNDKYNASTDIGVVSNVVKQELVKNAIISVMLASIGIILYISLRFRFSYAISSIIALVHDIFMIVAFFSLFKFEVSSIFIAAILSIIGYSINDTIVVFDRIRENLDKTKVKNEEQLKNVVNTSLRQTLTRSIITTLTTIIPIICLIVLGSHEIVNFNIALLVGMVVGVYSSLFVAAQIWFLIERKNIGKPPKKRWYEIDEKEELKVKGVNS